MLTMVLPPVPAAAEVMVMAVLVALAGMQGVKVRDSVEVPLVTAVTVYK